MIAMYVMQENTSCLCCSRVLLLHVIAEPQPSAQCHTIWTYGFMALDGFLYWSRDM